MLLSILFTFESVYSHFILVFENIFLLFIPKV